MRIRSRLPQTMIGLSLVSMTKFVIGAGLVTSMTGCCGWNPFATTLEPDVRSTYLSAVRDPETFDSRISSLNIPDGAPDCLNELAAQAFELEYEQVLSCDAFVARSSSWNACHEEAERIHNQGVILGDVARAIEGTRSFASSSGGGLLIFSKQVLTAEFGPQFYVALIDEFSAFTPDMQCDLGCI